MLRFEQIEKLLGSAPESPPEGWTISEYAAKHGKTRTACIGEISSMVAHGQVLRVGSVKNNYFQEIGIYQYTNQADAASGLAASKKPAKQQAKAKGAKPC